MYNFHMDTSLSKDAFGWGFALWLVGYILGFLLFAFVPVSLIGWFITPVGVLITLWVLFTRIRSNSMRHYALVALAWTLIAIICDFLFLVLLLKSADGYYKLDVFLYYALTFALPLAVGWYRTRVEQRRS